MGVALLFILTAFVLGGPAVGLAVLACVAPAGRRWRCVARFAVAAYDPSGAVWRARLAGGQCRLCSRGGLSGALRARPRPLRPKRPALPRRPLRRPTLFLAARHHRTPACSRSATTEHEKRPCSRPRRVDNAEGHVGDVGRRDRRARLAQDQAGSLGPDRSPKTTMRGALRPRLRSCAAKRRRRGRRGSLLALKSGHAGFQIGGAA